MCIGGQLFGRSACVDFASLSGYTSELATMVVGQIEASLGRAPSSSQAKEAMCSAFALSKALGHCKYITRAMVSIRPIGRLRRLGVVYYRIAYTVVIPDGDLPNLNFGSISTQARELEVWNSTAWRAFQAAKGISISGNITTIIGPTYVQDYIVKDSKGDPASSSTDFSGQTDEVKKTQSPVLLLVLIVVGMLACLAICGVGFYFRSVSRKAEI
jgi:hypothetical protein